MASWQQVLDYFRALDRASERVRFEELGKTTLGAPFVMATISAPANLSRLKYFQDVQAKLADPRRLGADSDTTARSLIARGKSIVLITCGIHSTEVGSYLSSMLIAHRLASSADPSVRNILENCIVLLVPSLNPDGVDIVKRWYDRTLGTPFEGTTPPELYHKYVGHDNNRDWYAFTQAETRLTVDKIHNVWHPQIVHDIHQQGASGARLFLPPYMPPVEPNVPSQLVEAYTELGGFIAKQMRATGFKGITTDSTYDAWTPARAYSHYHGGVRILSETASARIASPQSISFKDLKPDEGYDPRVVSPSFPDLWPGGEWRLGDITNCMTTVAFYLLDHAADNRERWLNRFHEIGKQAVRPRRKGELYGFKITPGEESSELLEVLKRGGVEIDVASTPPVNAQQPLIVKMAQPYGAFAKALLERQQYPDLKSSSGEPLAPYDVTAHTLPLLFGVEVSPLYEAVSTMRRQSISVGAELKPSGAGRSPKRIAIYRSHVPSMDEGWTRWVFEQSGMAYKSIQDAEVRAGNLRSKYDAILIPDQSPTAIFKGYDKDTMPPEFVGGLGEEGVRSMRDFVEAGGSLITLNRASAFAIKQFELPVRNVTESLAKNEFYVPGSILRIELDTTHPVAQGLREQSIAWAEDSPTFEPLDEKVRVIARYPLRSNMLLSGWLMGGDKINGKAALVEVPLGRGRIFLFGFRPQYRAQSRATYQLLFNALSK
ncbi:MAG: M14 metallopeptidase family protein [Pyrinomonadaceae bacterium]